MVTAVKGGRGILLRGDGPLMPRSGEGFDAVVGGSPDGGRLVVRSFPGGSTREPGPERLELVDVEGRRAPLGEGATAVIGWMAR